MPDFPVLNGNVHLYGRRNNVRFCLAESTGPRRINPDQHYLPLAPNATTEKSRKLRSLGVIRRSGVYKMCNGDAGTEY